MQLAQEILATLLTFIQIEAMSEPPESSDAEWRTVGLQNAPQRIRQNEEE
jgi:hypothetical protein